MRTEIGGPIKELRDATRDTDVGGGWVLVRLPDEGPIAVAASSILNMGQVLSTLTLGARIIQDNILFEDEEEGEAS